MAINYKSYWERGLLHAIDDIPHGDEQLGNALKTYSEQVSQNRKSLHWMRAVRWMENFFFSQGRHYIDDLLTSRLAGDAGNLSVVSDSVKNLPKPTNDLLSRYIETNIALLTENRPRPRVTPKSDRDEDITAAELSELTLEYLWEAMQMPEKMREIARLILHCGVCWMEVTYDPTKPRRLTVPQTKTENKVVVDYTPDGTPIPQDIPREVTVTDEQGRPVFKDELEFGDVTTSIISPFEMHVPSTQWWHDQEFGMGWIMREAYVPIEIIRDKYLYAPKNKAQLTKKNGWDLSVLDKVRSEPPYTLPLWWYQRVSELVEGPGSNIYIGGSDEYETHTVFRIFDRKPSNKWPKGRTIITAGDQVLYDSPKNVGARAYDPRWPDRWHPYVRFRWEAQPASVHGRSLITKLLPKLKRVNAIDTTLIMWRRTVPIASWVAPVGAHVVEDLWASQAGMIWEYDARRTDKMKPEPIYPPPYPQAALEERAQQLAEMESIAGTEEILRGQRPIGVNSASALDILRKQALMSRSPILQAWDESLQQLGSHLLIEVIRNIGADPRYAERIRVLAREKASRLSIENFSGADLSDNVMVRVDTASMALVSKEAREAKVLEFLQYAPSLMSIPDIGLRQAIVEELGFKKALTPQGPHIDRAKKMISLIKQGRFDRIVPMVEDDPYVMHELLVKEKQSEAFWDMSQEQQQKLLELIAMYRRVIEFREQQMLKLQLQMGAMSGQQQQQGGLQ